MGQGRLEADGGGQGREIDEARKWRRWRRREERRRREESRSNGGRSKR